MCVGVGMCVDVGECIVKTCVGVGKYGDMDICFGEVAYVSVDISVLVGASLF